MTLQNQSEVELTKQKILDLERLYKETLNDPSPAKYSRELTLRTLRRTINQLIEEIARYELRVISAN